MEVWIVDLFFPRKNKSTSHAKHKINPLCCSTFVLIGAVISALVNEPEGPDGDGSRENHNIPTSKPRKNRSPLWDHFRPIRNGRKICRAECKHCGDKVICGGEAGTSGMKRHIKNWSCLTRGPTVDRPSNHTRYY